MPTLTDLCIILSVAVVVIIVALYKNSRRLQRLESALSSTQKRVEYLSNEVAAIDNYLINRITSGLPPGPGTELATMLARLGFKPVPKCQEQEHDNGTENRGRLD